MKQPTALAGDVFAGLFTYGVQRQGFKVLGALEHSGYGTKTARLNFPDLEIRVGPQNWKPEEYTNKVDFMFTNPPCAAWSSMRVGTGKAGPSETWKEETARLEYIQNLTTAGRIIKPKAWAWESVANAWRHGREFVLEVADTWMSDGYHVTVLLQNNMFIGGNQNRPRMFLIAHRYPLVWEPFVAAPTLRDLLHKVPAHLPGEPRHPEMARSLQKLWKVAPKHGHVLRRALLEQPADVQAKLRPRPAMTVNRCRWDQTPGVFIGASKRLHPDEPRTLNWPEILRVCGLPMSWKTAQPSLEPASLECSRAVMPGVGSWLAGSVAAGLAMRPLRSSPHVRLVDLRDPEHPFEEVLYDPAESPRGNPILAEPNWPPVGAAPAQKPPKTGSREPRAARPPWVGQPRLGSGYRIRQMLVANRPNDFILATIYKEFPESRATVSDINWNRRKLRLQGGTP